MKFRSNNNKIDPLLPFVNLLDVCNKYSFIEKLKTQLMADNNIYTAVRGAFSDTNILRTNSCLFPFRAELPYLPNYLQAKSATAP